MSSGDSNLHWRGRTLRAVRRHLRLIEVQTHRLRAKLARLEADHEDKFADYLNDGQEPWDDAPDERPPNVKSRSTATKNGDAPRTERVAVERPRVHRPAPKSLTIGPASTNVVVLDPHKPTSKSVEILPSAVVKTNEVNPTRGRRVSRNSTRPVLVSFGVHAAILLICLPLTYVTLTNQSVFLLASPPALLDESAIELTNIEVDTSVERDVELQNVVPDEPNFNLSDSLLADVTPLDSLGATANDKDFGQVDGMPSDLGTLMAGAGKPDGGEAGGPQGSAVFFGTKSQGDRFVFVVDNSSSMKGGRLAAAIDELLVSINAMSRRQSFYVIFVSDQPYPMFYPVAAPALVPATVENKKRLGEWLTHVQLASGKNRELIKAIDLAASLQPEAVFLLWDGDLKYSEKVRYDVMNHLTRPHSRAFRIHTLGMGIVSLESETNLSAIAQANGGTYRRIEVPKMPQRP